MARILGKGLSASHKKLIKLRQSYDWTGEELNGLKEKYEIKKQRMLNKFVSASNKKLQKSAFLACDKAEYAQAELEQRLQKYDVKAYMKQRRINHGAVKAIFKAISAGESFDSVLEKRSAQMAALNEKRAKFVSSLEAKKQAFITKNATTDTAPYETLRASLEAEYSALSSSLDAKYSELCKKKTEKLESKLADLDKRINSVKASLGSSHKLPDDVLLEVRGLKMYFGGLKAVDDLSFDVKKGEIFGLIGPNGAGKTTVFNCITRFYDATGGDMYFENKYGEVVDLRSFKVHDIILQGIGRTFQNIELVKEISVLDNLLIAATRYYKTGFFDHMIGVPALNKEEKMLRAKAERILKFMGLERYSAWYAMGLPYGILKKVEIARALMADAKLIIMDEPAAGLNDKETEELTETIRKIRDEFGVTILLVEHDMGLVMSVCDTVCAISFGQMLGIGTTEEIQRNKAVQEAYLGVAEEE